MITVPSPEEIKRWRANLRLVGWVCLCLASILSASIYYQFSIATGSENWPSVSGEVLKFKINDGSPGSAIHAGIVYRYTVAGETFTGTRFSFTDTEGRLQRVARRFDAYPEGQYIPVYYNAGNPSQSVLEPGASLFQLVKSYIAYLLIIFMLTFSGILSLWYAAYWQRKKTGRYPALSIVPAVQRVEKPIQRKTARSI